MTETFQPGGFATLIGSLPLADHGEAIDLILEHTPEIPFWAQLPVHKEEGMMVQFTNGLPGLCKDNGKVIVNTRSGTFDDQLLQFYEEYMGVLDGKIELDASRFALKEDTARGFFELLKRLSALPVAPIAVKGQITGPFTLGTGIVDQNKQAIFYDAQLRDAAVKLLALKARWQVSQLLRFKRPVLIFVDEPGLAGFGSSEFTSISRDDISLCFEEIFEAVRMEGGLVGVHVCANTDWSLVLDSSADIVSFDAYAFFDRFILYPEQIKTFIDSGKILAWGIVPTLNPAEIVRETIESIWDQWQVQAKQVEALGIDMQQLINQSLITPSCGMGSLGLDSAEKVIRLTTAISRKVRKLKFSA
jgi:methionine synthase II (cobalamin-independent)